MIITKHRDAKEDAFGTRIWRILDSPSIQVALMDNGTLLNLEHESIPVHENSIDKFISDVVSTIKDQEETKNYDYLTGLPVRSVGQKYIASAMQKAEGCLVFLDMDNLKKINDVYGHKAGDRALKSLGQYVCSWLWPL